jgi:hypothetical protein
VILALSLSGFLNKLGSGKSKKYGWMPPLRSDVEAGFFYCLLYGGLLNYIGVEIDRDRTCIKFGADLLYSGLFVQGILNAFDAATTGHS